ncbi:MAG: glycosyltransferase family 4 protein [Anaerolineaceae bacterium]|nr:glycosyltransferase family 4 protein [Anaerolineaceae bacterium]
MRILVLIHEYPPVGGGGGRVAQDLCQRLASAGHEIHLLTAQCGELPPLEKQCGLTIERLPSGRREPFRADLRAMTGYVVAALRRGLRLAKQWKPDVIHAHFAVPAGAAAWPLSILPGTPYVLTAHLGDVPGGVPEKTGKWFRWIFPFTPPIWRRARSVIAVSGFTRQLALQSYPNVPVEVIPNGVDLQVLDPGEIALQDPPRIVFAGRLMLQKNPLQVVRSLAGVRDLRWQCEMLGDGPLMVAVQAEIAAHGLQDRIVLRGWVTPEQVLQAYARSDLLFMPSLSEGLPVAGVQALAMGLALVVSHIGGWADLVREGENGSMVPVESPAGFAAALRGLLGSPEKLLAARQASRNHAQIFNLDRIAAEYERVLRVN